MSMRARYVKWRTRRRERIEYLRALQMYREHKGAYLMSYCLEAVRGKR